MSELGDYSFMAIAKEGSKKWPTNWSGASDPIYQKYLEDKKTNKNVDVNKYIKEAEAYFSHHIIPSPSRKKKKKKQTKKKNKQTKKNWYRKRKRTKRLRR